MKDTNFLRFIAVILIVNSHLDKFYPIPALATGGTIGNSIFFFLSAFGLAKSGVGNNFFEWYGRRVKRIYPAVWSAIVMLVFPLSFIGGTFNWIEILKYLGWFFYPPFWFLQAIMVFYALVWFVIRPFTFRKLTIASVCALIVYVTIYINNIGLFGNVYKIDNAPYCIPFYFIVMLFGVLCAKTDSSIVSAGLNDVLLLILALFLLYGHKYLMNNDHLLIFQFFQQIAMLPIVYLLLKISRSEVVNAMMVNPFIDKYIRLFSSITLEIYLCHSILKDGFVNLKMTFPINILLFVGVSVVIAYCLKKLTMKYMSQISYSQINMI